jgi:hypothetical protein
MKKIKIDKRYYIRSYGSADDSEKRNLNVEFAAYILNEMAFNGHLFAIANKGLILWGSVSDEICDTDDNNHNSIKIVGYDMYGF